MDIVTNVIIWWENGTRVAKYTSKTHDTDLSHLENSSWLWLRDYFCATIKEMIGESLIPRLDCLKWDFPWSDCLCQDFTVIMGVSRFCGRTN